jgi:hypothetical protein
LEKIKFFLKLKSFKKYFVIFSFLHLSQVQLFPPPLQISLRDDYENEKMIIRPIFTTHSAQFKNNKLSTMMTVEEMNCGRGCG